MPWWMRNNLRMIQNNLRDIDAEMDIDRELAVWKDMGANVVQLGCGGITAFHPSDLECQRPSPYLKGDPFGTWLKKCHENDIRVIARFDFSKTHASFFEKHPEWFLQTAKGQEIRYHDTVATCVNGAYQQERSLDILREVLERYPVDGVFFNMFGYQTHDYSGNYTGICQCENCKRRFREQSGFELPIAEDSTDPVFRRYMQFKEDTVGEILLGIRDLVKSINPETAVSTYHHQGVDIVRSESNSAVDRPYPFWIYASSDNISETEGFFPDKISSNVAINAVDIPYRFMGVSPQLNQLRLYGNIASGSGLDWCIIGSFAGYPDRNNYETTRQVFQFHKRHEGYFGKLQSQARILLVRPAAFYKGGHSREFRGIFKALKEAHRLFRVMESSMLDSRLDQPDEFDVIIFPGVEQASPAVLEALKRSKALVIATGLSFSSSPEALKLFGVELGERLETVRGAYLRTEPKSIFQSFPLRDWVYLDMDFRFVKTAPGVQEALPLVSPARYGPPERCFGHGEGDSPGLTIRDNRFLYFPWMPGSLYYQHGFEDFAQLLLDSIDKHAPNRNPIVTDAPACVEVFFDACGENQYLLQFINWSGCNGVTVREPLAINGITTELPGLSPKRILELTDDGTAELPATNRILCDLPGPYKAFVLEV